MLRDKEGSKGPAWEGCALGSSLTLWRGERLSMLLAPAHWVDVGTAGITPETQEYIIVLGNGGGLSLLSPQHGTGDFLSLLLGERDMGD